MYWKIIKGFLFRFDFYYLPFQYLTVGVRHSISNTLYMTFSCKIICPSYYLAKINVTEDWNITFLQILSCCWDEWNTFFKWYFKLNVSVYFLAANSLSHRLHSIRSTFLKHFHKELKDMFMCRKKIIYEIPEKKKNTKI